MRSGRSFGSMAGSEPESNWPSATYRWQLRPGAGFDQVRRRLRYLRDLGIDTLYLSPVFAARRGSPHGYDGIDPSRFDAPRGGETGFRALARAAHRSGLRLLVDIVPNHLAISLENPAWRDVLARGRRSRFARLFDIDWHRRSRGGRPQVTLPWIDRPLADAFREGAVAFEADRGRLALRVGELRLPVPRRRDRRGGADPRARGRAGPLDRDLDGANRGDTEVGLRLRGELLARLPYRLVPAQDVAEINYRRFADISDLVGVRPNEPGAFAYLHRGLLRAVRRGEIDGLRVDHVDGIAEPGAYLEQLRRAFRAADPGRRVPYLVVEKILGPRETLPADWPVAGTTGYEALTRITQVLVPRRASRRLDATYRKFCGRTRAFAEEACRARREAIAQLFPGDRAEIARRFGTEIRSGSAHRRSSGPDRFEGAVTEISAALAVYRTYLGRGRRRREDRTAIRRALAEVGTEALPVSLSRSATQLARFLIRDGRGSEYRAHPRRALERWQQWTPAVAAKGIEDTAFYRYVRFAGSNEVGGDPGRIGCALQDFHDFMTERARRYPHSLTSTSTHDTKWGEDARARFVALADLAGPWGRFALRWRTESTARPRKGRGAGPTTPTEAYLLYQAWAGTALPGRAFDASYLRRLEGFVRKASREAKEATSWRSPDLAHEAELVRFLRARAHDRRFAGFRRELDQWVRRLHYYGGFYSLAQVVLRSTVPGVPDLYQGSEGWNFSMVDPDNRRSVPFDRLHRGLRAVTPATGAIGLPPRLVASARRGVTEALKLGTTATLLRYRGAHRALFDTGDYLPIRQRAPKWSTPVHSFARRLANDWMIVSVARGLARGTHGGTVVPLGARWGHREISLPSAAPPRWRDLLTGRAPTTQGNPSAPTVLLSDLFRAMPVAVLVPA